MGAIFGPAGNCEDFYAAGHKSSLDAPQWVSEHGLGAYEYQCGKGVKISDDAAEEIGRRAAECNVRLSVHAPYYISLSSTEAEKRDNSVGYILQTLRAARLMGAARVVVHSGSCGKITRREALNLAKDTLWRAIRAADEEGLGDITLCPETMGKVNQLGNVDEVAELCTIDERLIPTVDFGHVNAQSIGGLKTLGDYERVFDTLLKALGRDRVSRLHMHYSRIEYTASGEKKHRRFDEVGFEPEFDPIAEIVAKRGYSPIIICESAGTQTRDAVRMQEIYGGMFDVQKA